LQGAFFNLSCTFYGKATTNEKGAEQSITNSYQQISSAGYPLHTISTSFGRQHLRSPRV
jgi:hypothetical protein